MSKAVLISIRPTWCEKIAAGQKTIEVRKTRPKMETPFKCYIYCTQATPYNPSLVYRYEAENGNIYIGGKHYKEFLSASVIGEFVCDSIEAHDLPYPAYQSEVPSALLTNACLSYTDLHRYVGSGNRFYGWLISDLVIYDTPKEPSEFWRWADDLDDIRPCQNGKKCEHEFYDYGEGCMACAIDYDGTDCPYYKVTRPPQSWCYVEELS